MKSPIIINKTIEDILSLRQRSQSFQAEGRAASEDKERTNAIRDRFNEANELGYKWPIGLEPFIVATIEGREGEFLLGGFHRCIGLNSSTYTKDHEIEVVFYNEISMSDAILLSGADNLHLGKQESPLQRVSRIQAAVANGADLQEAMKTLNISKASFNQYVSTLENLHARARKALMKGEISDTQAKAISWLVKKSEIDSDKNIEKWLESPEKAVARKKEIDDSKKESKARPEGNKSRSVTTTSSSNHTSNTTAREEIVSEKTDSEFSQMVIADDFETLLGSVIGCIVEGAKQFEKEEVPPTLDGIIEFLSDYAAFNSKEEIA